jgi:hypothetical protein
VTMMTVYTGFIFLEHSIRTTSYHIYRYVVASKPKYSYLDFFKLLTLLDDFQAITMLTVNIFFDFFYVATLTVPVPLCKLAGYR